MRRLIYINDTQTGMLLGIPRSARCVQRFDDSLNSAIHITYRISLRSSSMREPRDPLLKVVICLDRLSLRYILNTEFVMRVRRARAHLCRKVHRGLCGQKTRSPAHGRLSRSRAGTPPVCYDNDPSAGSPTETLLRL